MRAVTADLAGRIRELHEAGLATADIAWAARCSPEVAAEVCRGLPPTEEPPARGAGGQWSADEDAIVERLGRCEVELRIIRDVLEVEGFRRPTRAIGMRLRKLGVRAARAQAKKVTR